MADNSESESELPFLFTPHGCNNVLKHYYLHVSFNEIFPMVYLIWNEQDIDFQGHFYESGSGTM